MLIARRILLTLIALIPGAAWAGTYGEGVYGEGVYGGLTVPGLGTLPVTGGMALILVMAAILAVIGGLLTHARLRRKRRQSS
jgi:hypothetical protein